MKLESRNKVLVKSCEFGGSVYRICGSIEPETKPELEKQMVEASAARVDVLEIVVNRYGNLAQFGSDLKTCGVPDIPVCIRIKEQGTDHRVDKDTALTLLSECIRDGLADMVDVEADDTALTAQVKKLTESNGVKLILTRQNYRGVIGADEVLETAKAVEALGPDLVRVLYLAADDVDMLHTAQAAKRAKLEGVLKTPFCISSIGDVGLMLRLFGERCGNDFGSYPLCRKDEGNFEYETLGEYRKFRSIYAIDDRY